MTVRLKTSDDVRRFLANTINKLKDDELKPEKAGRMGYLANILLRAIEGNEVEKRLESIEDLLKDRQR